MRLHEPSSEHRCAVGGPQAETDRPPEARGDPPPRQAGRAGARDRAQLQCLAQHDFTANGVTSSTPINLQCMDVEAWRLPTKEEMRATIDSRIARYTNRRTREKSRLSVLAARQQLSPVDMYCYLRARFGKPNGFQTFLRRDDSDNLVHWDFELKAGTQTVYISGASREIHFVLSETLADEDWRNLILKIKADYKRVGKEKSKILKSLEKWVIFPNKFVAVARICGDLHAEITDNIGGFHSFKPRSFTTKAQSRQQMKNMRALAQRAANVHKACLELSLLTPVMREAFINMLVLILCKKEVRNNHRQFEAFIRSQIDTKIFDLPYKCDKFLRPINQDSEIVKSFKRVMDKRNHAIHGNIDPQREQIETLYFAGRVPLFIQSGDHIGKFFEALERQHEPEVVVKDYEDMHAFFLEIMSCLEPEIVQEVWQIMEDSYPGYDVGRNITGRLLPEHVVGSYMPGLRYDDELKWGDVPC
jgi:hypothetical protein